ncbi:MAG: hypothetical protein SFW64_01110 [Alphaproteobacteria bacterium]|nr:hypothetical protein [Alphaproteobacteria bacterium]
MQSVVTYRNASARGKVESVDFSTVDGHRLTFLRLRSPAVSREMQQLLGRAPLHQQLVATTTVEGRQVMVLRGEAAPAEILNALKSQGESFRAPKPQKSLNAWKMRSILGFSGQALQLTSSFLRPSGKIDKSIFVFAVANLTANTINLVYDHGAQVDDTHRLRFLKQKMNREIAPHLPAGEAAFDINDNRKSLRPDEESHEPIDEAKGFLKRHSVAIGELGLRYLAAIGLAFPVQHWKSSLNKRQLPPINTSPLRAYTGLSSIFGKTLALGSKIPDPYNPEPVGWLDRLREKYTFLAGGWIEVSSFGVMAYDAFFNSTGKNADRGIKINGKLHRDWLGGIGASLFTAGYIARSWAKFGERHVNMEELYAHTSDTLARTPPEKVPQLLADTAASLSEHFKGDPTLNYASIYSNLAADVCRYHAQAAPLAPLGAGVGAPVAVVEKPANKPATATPDTHVQLVQREIASPPLPMAVASR